MVRGVYRNEGVHFIGIGSRQHRSIHVVRTAPRRIFPKTVHRITASLIICVIALRYTTRPLYLYFSTILTSRAFPSSLIPGYSSTSLPTASEPSVVEDSVPVLIPGVDMFNHEYARKVSWISDDDGPAAAGVTLHEHRSDRTRDGLTIRIETSVEAGTFLIYLYFMLIDRSINHLLNIY